MNTVKNLPTAYTLEETMELVSRQCEFILFELHAFNTTNVPDECFRAVGWWLLGDEFDHSLKVALERLEEPLEYVEISSHYHKGLCGIRFVFHSGDRIVYLTTYPQVPQNCPESMEICHIVSECYVPPVYPMVSGEVLVSFDIE